MDERTKQAFVFVSDTTKQLMTLATGILTLTVSFVKFVSGSVVSGAEVPLVGAWVLYLGSIVFGMWTMLALTGTLQPKVIGDTPLTIRGWNVIFPSLLQISTFVVATFLVVVFGFLSLK